MKKIKALLSDSNKSIRLVNFVFQRILRLNAQCSWSVHFTSKVVYPVKIKLGRAVEISFMVSGGCYIQAGNGIEIGDNTIFAPGVKIISANHDPVHRERWIPGPPVIIGKNCWLGANVVLLPGVVLGDNVIVGAGAVVTKSFPDNTVIAGNPAKVLQGKIEK